MGISIHGDFAAQASLLSGITQQVTEAAEPMDCRSLVNAFEGVVDTKFFKVVFGDAQFENRYQESDALEALVKSLSEKLIGVQAKNCSETGIRCDAENVHKNWKIFDSFPELVQKTIHLVRRRFMESLSDRIIDCIRVFLHKSTLLVSEKKYSLGLSEQSEVLSFLQVAAERFSGIVPEMLYAERKALIESFIQFPKGKRDPSRGLQQFFADAQDYFWNEIASLLPVPEKALSTSLWGKLSEETALPETLPSVHDLVQEFSQRTWSDEIPLSTIAAVAPIFASGYLPICHDSGRKRLLAVLDRHNQQFAERVARQGLKDAGCVERLDLNPGDSLYVRADLHSDLAALLSLLEMLQKRGDLDSNYHCRPGFHLIFLGDYLDRGANDIELLTLLLSLRMGNPCTVHLLKGNHEDPDVQLAYSSEGVWLNRHVQLFDLCYKSFPSAICAGERSNGERQFVHFSHALFSTSVDLSPLLSNQCCSFMAIQNVPKRPEPSSESVVQKRTYAWRRLHQLEGTGASSPTGYFWSDMGAESMASTRGEGYVLCSEDVHHYARLSGNQTNKVKAFLRGHMHVAREYMVDRKKGGKKVLVTTLPVGTNGGVYRNAPHVGFQRNQGLMLHVAPKVSDWKKQWAVSEGLGKEETLVLREEKVGLYASSPLKKCSI